MSGSMSGVWKRGRMGLVRHRQTKGSATDRLHLNHRVTPRLHRSPFDPLQGTLLSALVAAVFASFRSRAALQLEILVFSAINSAFSTAVKRPKLTPADRLLWAGLCAVWNDWQSSVLIVKVSTVIGWHRKAFGCSGL